MQRGYTADWPSKMKEAFEDLFGSQSGRYPATAQKVVAVRAPEMAASEDDSVVPFAALIHPSNPSSGPYGGCRSPFFPSRMLRASFHSSLEQTASSQMKQRWAPRSRAKGQGDFSVAEPEAR